VKENSVGKLTIQQKISRKNKST